MTVYKSIFKPTTFLTYGYGSMQKLLYPHHLMILSVTTQMDQHPLNTLKLNWEVTQALESLVILWVINATVNYYDIISAKY